MQHLTYQIINVRPSTTRGWWDVRYGDASTYSVTSPSKEKALEIANLWARKFQPAKIMVWYGSDLTEEVVIK